MTRAYAPSIAAEHCSPAMARTDGRNGLTESMAESQRYLAFRNARAHIRRFPSADFQANGGDR